MTADARARGGLHGAASANAFYKQQSAGATSFVGRLRADGDVAGPVAIGVSTVGCDAYDIAARGRRGRRGRGLRRLGVRPRALRAARRRPSATSAGSAQLPGRRTWTNGTLLASVVTHEIGHNLGAHHANAFRCTGAGGVAVMVSPSCETTEYGDPFDTMGVTGRLMSSWHRLQIGQLPAGQELRLKASQTVSLTSSDDFTSPGTRLLIVPRKSAGVPVASSLAVELRSPLAPFDNFAVGGPGDDRRVGARRAQPDGGRAEPAARRAARDGSAGRRAAAGRRDAARRALRHLDPR